MTPAPKETISLTPSWRRGLLALVCTMIGFLWLFRETGLAMIDIWSRSQTFTHGFLVPPISLWLIWRIRHRVLSVEPRPNSWILIPMACVGFAWLLGDLAVVGVVSQFALTTLLILSVPAVLGVGAFSRMLFPLLFLYFSVPFGEFALPAMMEWTASFTVSALRLTGVPVYREGLQFIIPSGSWSVVEACSGVRYLIASVVVGTLFAYLNFSSFKRRTAFILFSILVPLVANWFRAYMIVMLGHLSGNTLAVGVDHLIYGWVFFGIVMMLMFWAGARWHDDDPTGALSPDLVAPRATSAAASAFWRTAVLCMGFAAVWPFVQWRIDENVFPTIGQLSTLSTIPGWKALPDEPAVWTPRFLAPSGVRHQAFEADGKRVAVYIGFYRDQATDRKLISSQNTLVASDDHQWLRLGEGRRNAELDDQPLSLRTAELRAGNGVRLRLWQWYWVDGRLTANDFVAKLWIAIHRLIGQGDDSAVVIVHTLNAPEGESDAILESFTKAAWPAIRTVLDTARAVR